MRTVALVLRSDFSTKHGGDVVQAERYAELLANYGYNARITTAPDIKSSDSFDILHVFNVDQPHEFLTAIDAACGRPYVVSTIHHDSRYVRKMRRAQLGFSPSGVISLLPEALRDYVVYCHRTLRSRASARDKARAVWDSSVRVVGIRRSVAKALERAKSVLTLSTKEELALVRDFGASDDNFVRLPNGIEQITPQDTETPRNGVLVVGRIEQRKRQLELLRAAEDVGIGLTFIGPANLNSSSYAKKFAREVGESTFSRWLGPLAHESVIEEMLKARVLLNLSWVEVQSLVELEALAAGCFVIAGSSGGNAERFPAEVYSVHPSDIYTAFRHVEAVQSTERQELSGGYPTWQETVRNLAQVYENALST